MKYSIPSATSELPFLDFTGEPSDQPIIIEVDHARGVLYVHVDGRTALRICRSTFEVIESHKKVTDGD